MPEIVIHEINVTVEKPISYERLQFSEDLRQRLTAITRSSFIARILCLTQESCERVIADTNAGMNYFGVSIDDPTKISYLTYDRVYSCYSKGESHRIWNDKDYRYHSGAGKVVRKLLASIPVNLSPPDNDFDRRIHYCITENKPELFERHVTNLSDLFTEADFDGFNSLFRTEGFRQGDTGEVIYVRGHWIAELYHEKNYASFSGTLGNSCMRYERTNKYLDIYVKNPSICKLAVLLNKEGRVQGRALVWTKDGVDYYDRIYYTSDLIQDRMKAFFLTQGIETCYPGYSNYKKIRFDEDTTNTDFDKRVILRHDNYPYMDSLKFLEENQSFISNCDIQLKGSGYYILNDTSGQYEDVSSNTIECNHCGREVQEDDSVYVDNSNDENHNCSLCTDCGVYSEYHNTYITREYAVYVDSVDSWVIRDYAVEDYSGEYIVPRDAIVLIDGRYADHDDGNLEQYVSGEYFILNSSSYEYVEYNNQYYKVEDCEETRDGVLVPSQYTAEHNGEVWLHSDLEDHLNLNLI
jgi:hypothetical protein